MLPWQAVPVLALLSVLPGGCRSAPSTAPGPELSETPEVCRAVFDRQERASEVVLTLDAARREFPEGIAVDHLDNVYLGLRFRGEVLRFRPGGAPEVVTRFAAADANGNPLLDQGLLGLATDERGNVYAAVASFDPGTGGLASTHGVWRISPEGERARIPGTQAIFYPNALAFDRRGNLFVSSSTGPPTTPSTFAEGGIWRVPRAGSAELWLRDPELTGTGDVAPGPLPVGANGIAHHAGSLFVANSEKRQVVEVPIRPDGSPGPTRVVVRFPGPTTANPFAGVLDGLAVDACGDLYPVIIGESRVVRVSPDGEEVETIAGPADGLQTPTSVAFGGREDGRSAFIAEFAALAPLLGQAPEPKVVKVEVGVPGPDAR